MGERRAATDQLKAALEAFLSLRAEPFAERAERELAACGLTRIALVDHPNVGEIGGGGFTNWTARLMSDSKEPCLISCISTERLGAAADVSSGS